MNYYLERFNAFNFSDIFMNQSAGNERENEKI